MPLSNFLTFFSGFAGLGSEVLYLKLLDYTIGSTPILAFIIVAFFILGQALGSFTALKFRKIYLIEVIIGCYNLLWFFGHEILEKIVASSVSTLTPFFGVHLTSFLLGSALLAIPSIALGFSFPSLVEINRGASKTQIINSLGAFIGLLLMEFMLYPLVGIFNSLLILSLIHFFNAYCLRNHVFFTKKENISLSFYAVIIGVLTGVIQAGFLMLMPWIFQPFHYISTLVIMSFILGLSIGAWWYKQEKFQIENTLTNVSIGLLLSLLSVALLLKIPVQQLSFQVSALSIVFIILLVSIPIGTIFPALMQKNHQRITASQMNISLSLGNFIGIIIAFLLSSGTSVFDILLSVVILLFVMTVSLFFNHVREKKLEAIISVCLFAFCVTSLTEEKVIKLSANWNTLFKVEKIFRSHGELAAIFESSYEGHNEIGQQGLITERRLYQNGFSPIDLNLKWESVISAVGRGYSKNFDKALVLGAGSGRSAGTASLYFNKTDVVDVSPNVKNLISYLDKENYNLSYNPKTRYYNYDAILSPHLLSEKYDLIILTTDPGYHLQASKLYTKEFFKSIKSLLSKEGVFIFWLDQTITPEATQVIINSANDNFTSQKMVSILTSDKGEATYFLVVNSDSNLKYNYLASDLDPRLDNFLKNIKEFSNTFHETKELNSIFKPNWSLMTSGFRRESYGK